MSYTYATYKTALAGLLVVDEADADFIAILPSIIDYAEQRIYREADFLNTVVRNSSGTTTVGGRSFTLPTNLGRFVVINGINAFTIGVRHQLVPVSRDFMDAVYSTVLDAGLPKNYAMITDQEISVGPVADDEYPLEVIGTIRPTPLSENNTTTYLTLYLPDLFMAASMVFGSGWQKNFGSQADDPKMGASWETQYQTLFQSANIEEMRKKYASGAWGSLQPTPIATPNR